MIILAATIATGLSLAGVAEIPADVHRQTGSAAVIHAPATAAGSPCVSRPAGLVGWWSLDETSGTVFRDLVAGHDGRSLGGPEAASGVVDGALSFDGSDDLVEIMDSPVLDVLTNDFSITAWVKTTQAHGIRLLADKREFEGGVRGYSFFLSAGNLALQISDGVHSNYGSKAFVADGEFHHVAVTVVRSGLFSQGIFFVDGVPRGSFNPSARKGSLANSAPLRLGALSVAGSFALDGVLDEVQIFNRSLSDWEVAGIARAKNSGLCKCAALSSTPVAWWSFDEREGSTAYDIAGHFSGPHHGALGGFVFSETLHGFGKVGGALVLDGSTYMTADQGILLHDVQEESGFTIAGWIRTRQADAPILNKLWAPLDYPYGYELSLRQGALEFDWVNVLGRCTVPACSNLDDDQWHLIGATVSLDPGGKQATIRLYVDGRFAQSFPPTDLKGTPPVSGRFIIGARPIVARGEQELYFRGKLDELEVFDHALTESDFSILYAAGGAGQCKPAVKPQVCGIVGLAECPAGQFCQFLPTALCGTENSGGLCRGRPEICTFDEVPVCGCDGKTHSNECVAASQGVAVAYPGPCH